MHQKTCEGCKAEFTTRRKKIRFCSKQCSNKHVVKVHALKERTCATCGSVFYRRKASTCSVDCSKLLRQKVRGHFPTFQKLSDEDIVAIALAYQADDKLSISHVAKAYNINRKYLKNILFGNARPEVVRPTFDSRTTKLKNLPPLTDRQREIVVGSLLGDGYISMNNISGMFCKTQCAASKEYVEWHFKELGPYSLSMRPRTRAAHDITTRIRKPGTRKSIEFKTCSHPKFVEYRSQWYPNGIKVIPEDIELTPLSLAVWYCDDGSNHKNHKAVILHTQCFTDCDINRLRDILMLEYGLITTINLDGKKKSTIRVSSKSYNSFLDIVSPHITTADMSYKLIRYKHIKG